MYYKDDPIKLLNLFCKLLNHFGYDPIITNKDNEDIEIKVNKFSKNGEYGTGDWVYIK